MTTELSDFILGLRAIERYRVSGCLPREISVELSAQSSTGGALAMQGRRSGFFNQKSEGKLATPFGTVSFSGTRPFIGSGEYVSLTYDDGEASGRLHFPRFWGIVSCSNRARLRISGETSHTFEIWRPTVRFQETVGWLRPHKGKAVTYRLFSQNGGDKMFPDGSAFIRMQNKDALVLLASLFYMCIYPESVMEMD
jgi:hypothetical protein